MDNPDSTHLETCLENGDCGLTPSKYSERGEKVDHPLDPTKYAFRMERHEALPGAENPGIGAGYAMPAFACFDCLYELDPNGPIINEIERKFLRIDSDSAYWAQNLLDPAIADFRVSVEEDGSLEVTDNVGGGCISADSTALLWERFPDFAEEQWKETRDFLMEKFEYQSEPLFASEFRKALAVLEPAYKTALRSIVVEALGDESRLLG